MTHILTATTQLFPCGGPREVAITMTPGWLWSNDLDAYRTRW
jgi:hypothetical protein